MKKVNKLEIIKKSQICQNGGKCQNVKCFPIGATIRTH